MAESQAKGATIHGVDFREYPADGYEDPEILRELYVDKELGYSNIARGFDVSRSKIRYRIRKFGLFRDEQMDDLPDKEEVSEAYEQTLSVRKAADLLDIRPDKVKRLMSHYDIEVQSGRKPDRSKPATFSTNPHGYETWKPDSKESQVYVHRAMYAAEYGIDAIADTHIHHKNGIPWDNRIENLKPISRRDHGTLHESNSAPSIGLAQMDEGDVVATLIDAGYSHLLSDDYL